MREDYSYLDFPPDWVENTTDGSLWVYIGNGEDREIAPGERINYIVNKNQAVELQSYVWEWEKVVSRELEE